MRTFIKSDPFSLFVLYSKKELTFKQMLFRRILHFVLLEMSQLTIGYLLAAMNSVIMIMLFLSVFSVYLFTMVIGWIIDSKTAVDINRGLKRIQD